MKTLEGLAAELFQRFAKMEGKNADWRYLSEERRLAWMEDVMYIARFFMLEMKKELKPLKTPGIMSTVFEHGFHAGQQEERRIFHEMIEAIYEQLEKQMDDAEYTLGNKQQEKHNEE